MDTVLFEDVWGPNVRASIQVINVVSSSAARKFWLLDV